MKRRFGTHSPVKTQAYFPLYLQFRLDNPEWTSTEQKPLEPLNGYKWGFNVNYEPRTTLAHGKDVVYKDTGPGDGKNVGFGSLRNGNPAYWGS